MTTKSDAVVAEHWLNILGHPLYFYTYDGKFAAPLKKGVTAEQVLAVYPAAEVVPGWAWLHLTPETALKWLEQPGRSVKCDNCGQPVLDNHAGDKCVSTPGRLTTDEKKVFENDYAKRFLHLFSMLADFANLEPGEAAQRKEER